MKSFTLLGLIFPFYIILFLFLTQFSVSNSNYNPSHIQSENSTDVKVGFVFILTSQREHGSLQQLNIWEKYFEKVSKSQYAVVVINWPFGEELPPFVDTVYGHETDYGGVRYIESFLSAAQLLIRDFQTTGIVLLSGACLPLRPFEQFYELIAPNLMKNHSVLCEYFTDSSTHHERYAILKNPRVHKQEWYSHLGQGYCLHQSVLKLMIRRWRAFSHEVRNVTSIDEHYISYFLRALDHEHSSDAELAKQSLNSMLPYCLVHTEWAPSGHIKVWTEHLTKATIMKIRDQKEHAFFVRKVLHSCKVDHLVLTPTPIKKKEMEPIAKEDEETGYFVD